MIVCIRLGHASGKLIARTRTAHLLFVHASPCTSLPNQVMHMAMTVRASRAEHSVATQNTPNITKSLENLTTTLGWAENMTSI